MNTRVLPLFLALAAPGCVHHVDFSKLETPDGTALLQEVDGLQAHMGQVKGSGRIAVKAKTGSGEVLAFIAVRAPSSLHLELLDFFGSPSQVLVADGQSFGLYRRDQGTFLHGAATAEGVSRLLPVSLSSDDLAAIFLGRTPRLPVAPTSVEPDPEADAYRVTLVQGDRKQTLWIHPASKRVMRSVLEGPGGYTLVFERLVVTKGLPFARKITFTAPDTEVVLRWSEDDVELDGKLDPALFRVSPPPGARVVEVDGVGPGAG